MQPAEPNPAGFKALGGQERLKYAELWMETSALGITGHLMTR